MNPKDKPSSAAIDDAPTMNMQRRSTRAEGRRKARQKKEGEKKRKERERQKAEKERRKELQEVRQKAKRKREEKKKPLFPPEGGSDDDPDEDYYIKDVMTNPLVDFPVQPGGNKNLWFPPDIFEKEPQKPERNFMGDLSHEIEKYMQNNHVFAGALGYK